MESYSREFLQQYRKYHEADKLVMTIVGSILSHAASGHHGKFIQPLKGRLTHVKNEARTQIIQWMMNLLRNKFPDVDIEYREATDLRGNVDSEIVISWGEPTVKSNVIRL
jgi:hypothetical protein